MKQWPSPHFLCLSHVVLRWHALPPDTRTCEYDKLCFFLSLSMAAHDYLIKEHKTRHVIWFWQTSMSKEVAGVQGMGENSQGLKRLFKIGPQSVAWVCGAQLSYAPRATKSLAECRVPLSRTEWRARIQCPWDARILIWAKSLCSPKFICWNPSPVPNMMY
jgi:hypothetical protein